MGRVTKSQFQYMKEKLAHVEHERARAVTQEDVARILHDLESSDEEVITKALREVCPCRMSWEVFEQLCKPALRLRKHPSSLICGLANHIEQDTREVAALEAIREREAERQDSWEYDRRSRKR